MAPSDHVIPNTEAFQASLMQGIDLMAMGKFVTFGISPTRPETGYGYLELSNTSNGEAVELRNLWKTAISRSDGNVEKWKLSMEFGHIYVPCF